MTGKPEGEKRKIGVACSERSDQMGECRKVAVIVQARHDGLESGRSYADAEVA